MQRRFIKLGTPDVSLIVQFFDVSDPSRATIFTGLNITTLQYKYIRLATNNSVTISNWQSFTALTALTDAHTDNKGKEIGEGYYRVDLPDAVCAVGVDEVAVVFADNTNAYIIQEAYQIQPELVAAAQTDITSILADTNEIQGKLPTSYIMGSSDTDNHDTDIDAILVDTSTTLDDKLDAISLASIADAVWDEAVAGHVSADTFGEQCKTDIDAILVDTTAIVEDTGTTLNDKIDVIDTNIGQIETAVVTDIPTTIADLDSDLAVVDGIADELKVAVITNAAGADIAADIAAVKAETAEIVEDTGTTIPATIETIDTVVDTIQAQTDQLVFTAGTVNANLAGGSIGTGSVTVPYYVFTNESAETGPIAGVSVWISTDGAGETVIASGITDSDGKVIFYLEPDIYYFWRSKTGYAFTNPDTEIVS